MNEKTGVTISLPELLQQRVLAKPFIKQRKYKHKNNQLGQHQSKQRGRGMLFEEVREYMNGDDPRLIDWRVTARTGKPHTKIYSEESERDVILMVDYRDSMHFGTKLAFKKFLAAQTASLLAWIAKGCHDPVGLLLFNDTHFLTIPPSKNTDAIHNIFKQLTKPIWQKKFLTNTGITAASQYLQQLATNSDIYILSDFYNNTLHNQKLLSQLTKKNQLSILWFIDKLERTLPVNNYCNFSDGNQTHSLYIAPSVQEQYQNNFKKKYTDMKLWCNKNHIKFMPLYTEVAIFEQMLSYQLRNNKYAVLQSK